MPANFNSDEISNDNLEIVEEDGDLIYRHIPSGAEFIFDSTENAWVPAQGLDLRGSGLANAQLATDLDVNNNSVSNVGALETEQANVTNESLFRVIKDNDQDITSNSWTKLEFDNVRLDERDEWDQSTFEWSPAEDGWYWTSAQAGFISGGTDDEVGIRFRDNEDITRGRNIISGVDASNAVTPQISTLVKLNSSRSYRVEVFNSDNDDTIWSPRSVTYLCIRSAFREDNI